MKNTNLVLEADSFFDSILEEAFSNRQIEAPPMAKKYLLNLLMHYLNTENLFDEVNESGKKTRSTLAELYLKAVNAETSVKKDLFKKLGDVSLYVGGFFAESLNKKIIDVDYYVNMGETAYDFLSKNSEEDLFSGLYSDFSKKFVDYMDVLAYISYQSNLHTNNNLLKLYENYQKTGSSLAKETLIEQGFIVEGDPEKKSIAQ